MKKFLLLSIFTAFTVGLASAQINSVGLIGPATPGGWDVDTNMVQDAADTNLWTMTIELVPGECKFRANDDWAINWGNDVFPVDTAVQDGLNIPIPFGGEYDVTFNSGNGYYYFSAVSPVGIIGSATPFGWDADINMSPVEGEPNKFITELDLIVGEAKFRLDDDWAVNWGSSDFPTGTGTQDGDNIPIPQAGNYTITLDTMTGDYEFKLNQEVTSVGIFGDATPGGWDMETAMNQDPNSPTQWSLGVRLSDGGVQFSGDSMAVVWGGSDFPSGTAEVDGDTIPVTEGLYQITFDSKSGEYEFTQVEIYETVGIIGDATPGGWDTDTDLNRSPDDSSVWTLRLELLDGFAKFRADDGWDVNWGAGEFPSGTAIINGADIPVTAGDYNITFNSFTGVYNFQEVIEYDTVGLIGTGSPFGDWDNDVYMEKSAEDFNVWTLSSVTLLDGECKFRVNSDWGINWGADSWPDGVGTQDGPNIPISAGTYGVTLNTASGEYLFGDVISSTQDIVNPSEILAFPNPAQDVLNIDVSAINLQGRVDVNIYDMSGNLLASSRQTAQKLMQIDVSKLPVGQYALQITSDSHIIGKRFVIVR